MHQDRVVDLALFFKAGELASESCSGPFGVIVWLAQRQLPGAAANWHSRPQAAGGRGRKRTFNVRAN